MVDFTQWIKEEFALAQRLKDNYCDASGKETEPAKAAEIIHKIGIVYRKRSPDKIALIQSVGLFNAAIVRNPSNIAQIKSDLNEICQHILRNAEAKSQNVSLVGKAEQVKAEFEKLRTESKAFLEKPLLNESKLSETNNVQILITQKISAVRKVNKQIAYKYKQIMADVSQYCEHVMGKPPCKYSIAGMGSLARDEITSYSDFEHIILLQDDKNYQNHMEFFRWFSAIFNAVILNLQETIIPSLNVRSLNDKEHHLGNWFYDVITPRGISFDGLMPHACKFPLGCTQHTKNKPFKTELIKPVSEMLEYLSSEADLKNGYHLADILTKTCFVYGNESIYKEFVDGVQAYLERKSKTEAFNDVKQQVKDDLNKYSTRFQLSKLRSLYKINIKQLVYRSTTIFISAQAALYKISANSSFDIIDQLVQQNEVSESTGTKLRYAIAIATEMRLKLYMKMKRQKDEVIKLNHKNGIRNFLDIVGTTSTISYFQIAYCLQCEVAKQLNLKKLYFYSNPQLINITIGLAFEISELVNCMENENHISWQLTQFNFDTCIEHLETKTQCDFCHNLTTLFIYILGFNFLNCSHN